MEFTIEKFTEEEVYKMLPKRGRTEGVIIKNKIIETFNKLNVYEAFIIDKKIFSYSSVSNLMKEYFINEYRLQNLKESTRIIKVK